MDSYDREPSYYEVSLTNRQVVTGFVILLVCVFGAFLSGVWMGRGGGARTAGPQVAAPQPAPDPGRERLEQLSFFGEREAGARSPAAGAVTTPPRAAEEPAAAPPAPPPDAAPPTPAETEADKLRRTLEAEMAAHREGESAAAPAAVAQAAPSPAPGARVQRAPAPETARPAAAPAAAPVSRPAAAAATWIQVYSSTNGARAQELASRLRGGGFEVRILESATPSGANHRVRVGPYATRDAAEGAAARLRREFRLDTWVTDSP